MTKVVRVRVTVRNQCRLIPLVKTEFTGSGRPARVIEANLTPRATLIASVIEIAPEGTSYDQISFECIKSPIAIIVSIARIA